MNDPQLPVPAWSTNAERTAINPETPRADSNEALDRALIAERINRYGWAFDERRLDQMTECFTEDAVWEGSVMGIDTYGPFNGRGGIRAFMSDFFPVQTDQRRHQFSNFVIEFTSENHAVAHAYLVLWGSENDHTQPVTAGPYRFALVRQDGVWLLSELHGGWDSHF